MRENQQIQNRLATDHAALSSPYRQDVSPEEGDKWLLRTASASIQIVCCHNVKGSE
jgi:hypothetical protein